MARPTAPEVEIDLDRRRKMILNFSSIYAFEKETGSSLLGGFNPAAFDDKEMLAFLWATLHEDDPDLTLEAVHKMMYPSLLAEVSAKIADLIRAAFVVEETGDRPLAARARKRRTG